MTAEVTQADREAAAGYYYSSGGSPKVAREISEGKKDEWFRVQAFARHRIASTTPKDEAIKELVAGLNLAAGRLYWAATASPGVSLIEGEVLVIGWAEEAKALIAKHSVKP